MKKQNAFQLASLQVGGAICLPLLLVGYELAKENTPGTVCISIIWGNLLLFLLALAAGSLSRKHGLPTAGHAIHYFGNLGKQVFGLVLALTMIGWFGIQSQCMGKDLYHLSNQIFGGIENHETLLTIIFSILISFGIILGAYRGVSFLTQMSNLCVPLLIGTIIYAMPHSGLDTMHQAIKDSSIVYWEPKVISLVVASSIGATIDLPTFYRHAKNPGSTTLASFLTYIVATPFVQIAGLCLYHATHEDSISQALASGDSIAWNVWIVIFMLLAGWTTNNVNLYSINTNIQALVSGSHKKSFLVVSIVVLIAASLPLLTYLTTVLETMGVMVIAMGETIFIAHFCKKWLNPLSFRAHWIAASGGIAVGLLSLFIPQFGGVAPLFDAAIATFFIFIAQLLLENLLKSKLYKQTANLDINSFP